MEWNAVKNAKPLFKEHRQPKKPLNNNYYDLSDEDASAWKWQAELARKYGIFGFCIYNYWFTGKQLLEKPMSILLKHKEINIKYCICWANDSWTKTWYGLGNEVLIEQKYGKKDDWLKHYQYMLPYFKDERYIKIGNKPVLNIYRSSEILELVSMIKYWNELSQGDGFEGLYIVSGNTIYKNEDRDNLIDAYYNFEPGYTLKHKLNWLERLISMSVVRMKSKMNALLNKQILERKFDARIINHAMLRKDKIRSKPIYKGAFPQWDNTSRRGYKGMVYTNTTPKTFYERLKKIDRELSRSNKDEDFVYINAWNEWGEGAYLEPDENNGYEYLEMIRKITLGIK